MGRAFQWAREFGFNSVEAGATLVSYTCDFVTARGRGIYRRMIVDNGSGMTRAELADCINKIGGGKSERGAGSASNLGQGAKVASAYFNPAGVVYLSRTPEDGDAIAIYVRNAVSGEYGLLRTYGLDDSGTVVRRSIHRPQPLFLDEDGTIPVDGGTAWDDVLNEAMENIGNPDSGTAVVFLGTGTDDTIFGDPERPAEASQYGLSTYLDSRIWEIPDHVTFRVAIFHQPANKDRWPESEQDPGYKEIDGKSIRIWNFRAVKGLKRQMLDPDYLVDYGSVSVVSRDGIPATVDWVITEFAAKKKSGGERKEKVSTTLINPGGIGTIMAVSAAAKMGLYDVMDFVVNADANSRFRDFGIDALTVQDQLWFTITPQVYRPADRDAGLPLVPGVGMDPSRSHLVATSRERHSEPIETLMHEWGADFQTDAKFPAPIRKLLDEAWASHAGAATVLDEKTTSRIAEALKGALTREVAIAGGHKPTVKTPGGGPTFRFRRGRGKPGPGPKKPYSGGENESGPIDPESDKDATPRKIDAVLPKVVWQPGDHEAWATEAKGSIALFRLPGLPGGSASGVVWLRGTDPSKPPAERLRADGKTPYGSDDWKADESPVILAAVQDKQSEPGYGPSQALAIEHAVKEAYVACAKAVAAHLLAQGRWDPDAKEWNPTDGVTVDMMKAAVEPFAFSNALRGYYPQKQIAAGFMGSISRMVKSRKPKAA